MNTAHGGTLVNRVRSLSELGLSPTDLEALPSLELNERSYADLECIATGVYSPLTGFVGSQDHARIVSQMRLENGLPWSIPITLQISEAEATNYSVGNEIALATPAGDVIALMAITDKYQPDQQNEAPKGLSHQ